MTAASDPTSTQIPLTADAMSSSWLTEVLRSNGRLEPDVEVVDLHLEPIGEVVGVFGTVHRVTPSYSGPTTAPTTFVAKFPTDAVENKTVGMALDIYAREIHVLRNVAAHSPGLDHARVVHADMDPANGAFALLVEEVTGKSVGDQLAGLSRTQVESVLDVLAELHAHWWDHPELATSDWLPRCNHPVQLAVVPGIMTSAMPVVAERYGERLGPEKVAMGNAVAEQYADLMHRIAERARTFTHTDMRAVNLFFDDAGSDVTIIDWQLCTYSVPMQDAMYLYGSSITVEDFAAWGVDTMRHYHERLNAHLAAKGESYSWDDLWLDSQLVALWALVSPCSTVATFEMGNELGAKMSDAWVDRGFNLPMALGAPAILR
jgi:hypothetical protein